MLDLSIHLQGLRHESTLEASQEDITNLTMWFSFVDDLGYAPSVTTQDTRYVSCHYWPHRVSQSSED